MIPGSPLTQFELEDDLSLSPSPVCVLISARNPSSPPIEGPTAALG